MDNQHRIIKGYRDLSQAEIDLMNEIKAEGERLQTLVEKVKTHLVHQDGFAKHKASHENDPADLERLQAAEPEKWADWSKGTFQTGLMQLVRAVAQPTTF